MVLRINIVVAAIGAETVAYKGKPSKPFSFMAVTAPASPTLHATKSHVAVVA